ncbi:hypothetical protein HDU76_009905, partial [Blyttiomyces sp. JEL0837]
FLHTLNCLIVLNCYSCIDYANVGHSDDDYVVNGLAYTAVMCLSKEDLTGERFYESIRFEEAYWGFFYPMYSTGCRLSGGMVWSFVSKDVHGTMLADLEKNSEVGKNRLTVGLVCKRKVIEKLKQGLLPTGLVFYQDKIVEKQ